MSSTAERPVATVIIVTYNSSDDIVPCLDGLAKQDLPEPYEVIVVDNGSTDGTPDLVESNYTWVRLVRNQNTGFGAGNNLGARHARGEVLAFLNPDAVPDPGWLRELIEPARAPGTITTSVIVLASDPQQINACGNWNHFGCIAFANGLGDQRSRWTEGVPLPGISGAAFAVHRADWDALGGFDERIFLYLEDADLSIRARARGLAIVLAPRSVASHTYHLDLGPFKLFHLERSRTYLLRKHLRLVDRTLLAPSLLVIQALSLGLALVAGRGGLGHWWRGHREGRRIQVERGVQPEVVPITYVTEASIPFHMLWPGALAVTVGALLNTLLRLNAFVHRSLRGRSD